MSSEAEVMGYLIRHRDFRKGDWYPTIYKSPPPRLGPGWEVCQVLKGPTVRREDLPEEEDLTEETWRRIMREKHERMLSDLNLEASDER